MDNPEQPRTQSLFVDSHLDEPAAMPQEKTKPRIHWVAFAVVGVALLVFSGVVFFAFGSKNGFASASGPKSPTAIPICSTKDGAKVYDLAKQNAQRWDDANELASSTSRIAMAPQVAELQKIRRDVQAQEFPECGKKVQDALVLSMDGYINGYLAFLRQDPDSTVSSWFAVGRKGMDNFGLELLALSGAPASPAPAATATVSR